jgi:protein O-GlcNAc transferase
MKKIISFSIWGNNPIYKRGLLRNIQMIPHIYPGFTIRVYYDESMILDWLSYVHYIELIKMHMNNKWDGLFWRFKAISESDITLIRDTDSLVNVREAAAVNEWLLTNYSFHCMRDHIEHNVPIMGGMFGCRNNFIDIDTLLSKWNVFDRKGSDQDFLANLVWPIVRKHSLVHDKYYNGVKIGDYEYNPIKLFGDHDVRQFPAHPPYDGHVGQIINF